MPSPLTITLVIRQPKDPRACQLMLEQMTYVARLYGGSVTSTEQGDAIAMRLLLADQISAPELRHSKELNNG
ncbi:hypothetical protein HDC32_003391 [Pseudomonas sp. JAI120]|nr:hypothetical protein [Pseudomonas sp. SJZ073]MBB6313693.1 hypothetical protein [Pseudomonas sp. JAI120]